jgi:hypothetical protein
MILTITEEIFLLALYEKGSIPNAAAVPLRFALGGAVLADLLAAGKIRLDEHQKVLLLDETPGDDPILNEIIEMMQASHHPRKVAYWIDAIIQKPKRFLKRLGEGLVKKGVLNQAEKRFLWVIPYVVFPQQDASAKYWIKQHLRAVVLAGEIADTHALMVLDLIRAGGLLDFVFTRDELKAARKRIASYTGDGVAAGGLAQEISEPMAEINAAVTALAVAAVRP